MTVKRRIQSLMLKFLPTKVYVKVCYRYFTGRTFDSKNMCRFTEKRWWLKFYYQKYMLDLIQKCYDKYTVREYVQDKLDGKLGTEILNDVYGIYDDAKEINFDCLPEKFVLKVTQSNGYNILVKNKYCINENEIKKQLNSWLIKAKNADYLPESKFYFNGKAKIICEKYLEDKEGNIPRDYKIFCFNGIPKFTYVTFDPIDSDGIMTHDYTINLYDDNWKYIPVQYGEHPTDPNIIVNKPENYDQMLKIASVLSQEFPFVRVDLYNIDGKIYFGELTWVPSSDSLSFDPDEYDFKFGEMLKLPQVEVF